MGRVSKPERMTRARSSLHASSALGASQDGARAPAKLCYVKGLPNEVIRRILYYLDLPSRINASATGRDFFCNSDSLAFIADVPKFTIVRRCDPRPGDRLREQRLDNENGQRHRIFDALMEPRRAENLKSFTLLQRTEVPVIETALGSCRQRLKAAVFRDYSRLQTLQVIYQLFSSVPKLEHLHIGFPLPKHVLQLVAERCNCLRELAIPLQASTSITSFHSLRKLTILDADLESAALGGPNGVVVLFLDQLDTLAMHVKGYPEPSRWPRRPFTRISLDGFPRLQHVSIFSNGPFSSHNVLEGSAINAHALVIDGPFEFHYPAQLRALYRKFHRMKSLSVRNLRFFYSPMPQQGEIFRQLENLEIVEVDPRYFIATDLKLTRFRMSRAVGIGDLGGVVDILASSLQQQRLRTLSLCLPARLPLDSTFVNLIASTNVSLQHLQLIGKKVVTYEDRWRLLRCRLVPSLETAHIQGGWLATQAGSEISCGIPLAAEDVFYLPGRTHVIECLTDLTLEQFNGRFMQNGDPSGHFAFACGTRSRVLTVGEGENHVHPTIEPLSLMGEHETELRNPVSAPFPFVATSGLPYGMQHDFTDPMGLT